jgi:hypothetical protein
VITDPNADNARDFNLLLLGVLLSLGSALLVQQLMAWLRGGSGDGDLF